MSKIIICLWFAFNFFSFSQSQYQSREEKLEQLKTREDIKVTEVEKGFYKIENKLTGDAFIEDMGEEEKQYIITNVDSMVIEIFSIDTSLYSNMYSHWLDLPITNFFYGILINDFNSNGLPELYGNREIPSFLSPAIYELSQTGAHFNHIFTYPDTILYPTGFYDIDNDGLIEILVSHREGLGGAIFYKQPYVNSLPTMFYFEYSRVSNQQVNTPLFGDLDKDGKIDFVYQLGGRTFYIAEFDSTIMNFDTVYSFRSIGYLGNLTLGDFDMNGKIEIVTGNTYGTVHIIEAQGNNQYQNVWNGSTGIKNSYKTFWSKDIDKNGKPEIWVAGKHITRGILITCFETIGEHLYKPVFKIKIPDYYSLYPLMTRADDLDGDGEEEIIICADYFKLFLKFSGSPNNHNYNIWYFSFNNFGGDENWAFVSYDIDNDNKKELFIDIFKSGLSFTRIFKPNFTVDVKEQNKNDLHNFFLYNNYPNPFNPATNVRFKLRRSEVVKISVYNLLGKEIRTLVDDDFPVGEYTIEWDGRDNEGNILPSGVYFIQMKSGEYQRTIKATLLK